MTPPVLFLDVDGVANKHVAHPNGYCGMEWENVQNLNRVIAESGCRIVVSSAWRYNVHSGAMTLDGLVNLFLTHGLNVYGNVVVGITRRDTSPEVTDRGAQIAEYVAEHRIERYAVVDDGGYKDLPNGKKAWTDLGILEHHHPAVITDGTVGLTIGDAVRLIQMLSRTPKENA